jgi:hypothetical protein
MAAHEANAEDTRGKGFDSIDNVRAVENPLHLIFKKGLTERLKRNTS